MSKSRLEAITQTKEWLQRNNIEVIEESHTSDFDEFFINDDGVKMQVYISDYIQVVNEL